MYPGGFKSLRKEVIQPHVPVRLPCYDFAPVTRFTFAPSNFGASGAPGSHGVTGGVYKGRERIHRRIADRRLLAIPASRGRVADPDPNWGWVLGFASPCGVASLCPTHCSACVAPDIKATRT